MLTKRVRQCPVCTDPVATHTLHEANGYSVLFVVKFLAVDTEVICRKDTVSISDVEPLVVLLYLEVLNGLLDGQGLTAAFNA